MSRSTPSKAAPPVLGEPLSYLKLHFVRDHYEAMASEAARAQWGHVEYLARLVEGEALARQQRSIQRRIRLARFPVVKTLDSFQWTWPRKINRAQVQNLFRLRFLDEHANVIFLGNVGLGKTHLASALGYAACLQGHSVLFATAVDVINTLNAARQAGRLKPVFQRYLKPAVLILDELGYLPIDKTGADLLFQIISQRYERGAIILTSNRVFKNWAEIFNHDATLTSALLDRLLHHAETVLIEGKSYRMKDRIET
ncbi:MAG: IS21-like element helper ATPase IstB [Pseudomonadota bacterium]|nr:IS21-like element helper ATPase IstB [Pseudomonadota bacterium]